MRCFEYFNRKHTLQTKVIDILSHPSKYSKIKRKWANQNKFPISNSPEWDNICDADRKYQKENGLPVEGASWYADKKGKGVHENLAEVGSMVAFHDIEDKSMAVQEDGSMNNVYFDEWVKCHPNKYEFLIRKLNEPMEISFKSYGYI